MDIIKWVIGKIWLEDLVVAMGKYWQRRAMPITNWMGQWVKKLINFWDLEIWEIWPIYKRLKTETPSDIYKNKRRIKTN